MSVETYAPLSLILKFQRFLHKGCWNSKWKANFNLVWTLWGIDRLGVLRMMKQMHHDFVVKVREVNAGDMSCLLGSATGLLQRLWLVLSSLCHLGKKKNYILPHLNAWTANLWSFSGWWEEREAPWNYGALGYVVTTSRVRLEVWKRRHLS